jgi:hypothetical protein
MTTTNNQSLQEIVFNTTAKPTIVNEQSKFVVVTYWWGRGNFNANISRPCMSFYEQFTTNLIKLGMNYFIEIFSKKFKEKIDMSDTSKILQLYDTHIKSLPSFKRFIEEQSNTYLQDLYQDIGLLDSKDPTRFTQAKDVIIMMREDNQSPRSFLLLDNATSEQAFLGQLYTLLSDIALEILRTDNIKHAIYDLFRLKESMTGMQSMYLKKTPIPEHDERVKGLVSPRVLTTLEQRKIIMNNLKGYFKEKTSITVLNQTYNNSNIYDVLNQLLRYRSGSNFQDMIERWEKACKFAKCNYLAVEYDYFSRTKQYQLAINAKPLFIKKALELCDGRSVVYIDGDMFVRKYPHIFDMSNIDFMARGWNMDPRSNEDMNDSIWFNPYKFETSGGIMYFSPSHESTHLIDVWIDQCSTPANIGKADDRILSMIFNMKKYMLNMNIIQLPVEYLWLTITYTVPMLDHVYDWDQVEMHDSIFIDHPECLTSEETAGGNDMFSDRAPKLHRFLDAEEDDSPISEEFYEYFVFETSNLAKQFQTYHQYLNQTTYKNDGNPILIDMGLVDPEDSSKNERPLYITPFEEFYGPRNKKVKQNSDLIRNELDANFWSSVKSKQILSMKTNDGTTIILCENNVPGGANKNGHLSEYLIPMIISIINKGYSVIYLPDTCREECYLELLNSRRQNLDLVFFPVVHKMEHMLKPVIDVSQPIYFHKSSKHSRILLALLMFENLEDMSSTLSYGSYQIISRIRIGYVYKTAGKPDTKSAHSSYCTLTDNNRMMSLPSPHMPVQVAGASKRTISENEINEYLDGQHIMYGSGAKKSKKPKKFTRKRNHKKQKRRKTKKRRRSRK